MGSRFSAGGFDFGLEAWLDAFALADMKDLERLQDGVRVDEYLDGFLRPVCVLDGHVLQVGRLPKDDRRRVFALADAAAFLLALVEGQPLAALEAEEHLVEERVGLAAAVADGLHATLPRLLPRDAALLHLLDDFVSYFFVEVDLIACVFHGSKGLKGY